MNFINKLYDFFLGLALNT